MTSGYESYQSVDKSRRELLLGLAMSPPLTTAAGAAIMSAQSPQPTGASATDPIVVFDVNETLLNFNVLTPVFLRIFDDPKMLREWFNQVVLYSEALTLAGQYADSGTVGVAVLQMLADVKGRVVGPSDLNELKRLSAAMPTYPDTADALARLKRAGFRLVTLSQNATAGVEAQLSAARLRSFFEQLHSIDDDEVRRYKPARESYTSLAAKLGASPSDMWFVSCHAFDALGAASAGYRTALLLRPENAPIALGKAPDIIGTDLRIVAEQIGKKAACSVTKEKIDGPMVHQAKPEGREHGPSRSQTDDQARGDRLGGPTVRIGRGWLGTGVGRAGTHNAGTRENHDAGRSNRRDPDAAWHSAAHLERRQRAVRPRP
jgi:2-haloacid dehalogenase